MWTAVLIIALLLFVYPFVVYPAMLRLFVRLRPAAPHRPVPVQPIPSVALVICALNEQNIIGAKLENSLALRYPRERLRIVVISDGSTDATATVAARYKARGIEVIEQPVRRGKVANLNEVLPQRTENVLVLSDANVLYAPDALLRLVSRLQDPAVGCVSGKVILTDSEPALDDPTKTYYSLEWFMQEQASHIGSMVGADGAMYAIRRELFRPCPDDTIIEDYIIAMSVIRQGKRVVLEPDAIGWEQGAATLKEELRRKTRIAAGAVQGLLRGNAWPWKASAGVWFVFISHKLLRWISPLTGLAALLLACAAPREPLSAAVLVGAALLSVLAGMRLLTGWAHPLLSAPFYFFFGQTAQAVGLLRGFSGRQTVLWAKTNR